MNVLLWVLQVLTALIYGGSGIMKAFMLDKISEDVPSFGALPREVWKALGWLDVRLRHPDRMTLNRHKFLSR